MLKTLSVQNLRILNTELEFSDGLNLICGDNGSGKSSIIESLHYMAFGRSFRAPSPVKMIAHNASDFLIRASMLHNDQVNHVAVMKSLDTLLVKKNESVSTLSRVSEILPTVFIDSHSHRQFFSSSSTRRSLFDWLAFHVKHDHMSSVRRYNKALLARNHALKSGVCHSAWDKIIDLEGARVHTGRCLALEVIVPFFKTVTQRNSILGVSLEYVPGFDERVGIEASLQASLKKDRLSQRTTVGPHLADWSIRVKGAAASDYLSQGQMKMVYFSLVSAVYELYRDKGVNPVFLMDDFAAELDESNQGHLSSLLFESGGQVVVTAISKDALRCSPRGRVFHVKQGCVGASG